MKRVLVGAMLLGIIFLCLPIPASAQTLGELFRSINPSVVVIRAKGRDVAGTGGPVGDVTDHRRVRDILENLPPGREFTMTVLRLGNVIELKGRHP